MTRRVAFVIDVVDSYGERELALRFAARLPAGVEPTFVAPAAVAPHLEGRGATRVYATVAEALDALRALEPALVVCCELYNLPPELCEGIAAGPWRVATTDGTSMGVEINENPHGEPVPPRTIAIPEHVVRLRNCPVNDPAPDSERLHHWSLFPGLQRGDGARARRELGVAPGARLAMMAISGWALRAASALGQQAHYPVLLARMVDALDAAGEDAELVLVAPQPLPARRSGRVTVRTIAYLPPDAYERLLLGSDLVVTDNVIQLSTAKAFAAGIPTLVLVNSDPERGMVYNIFPLKLRFPENAYTRALAPVERDDIASVRARVAAAWRDGPAAGDAYRAALELLRSPADIVVSLGV